MLRLATLVQYRTALSRIVRGVDDVLDADGQAVQGAGRQAGLAKLIGGLCLLQRFVAIQVSPGTNRRLEFVDTCEAGCYQFLRSEEAILDCRTRGTRTEQVGRGRIKSFHVYDARQGRYPNR